MPHPRYTTSKRASLLSVAAVVLYATAALAQSAKDGCGPTQVIPLTGEEPPAKIVTDPPLAEPLASRGVAIIYYCVQNLHLVPVFGPNALAVSPRVGHIHVTVDDASWVWADASGNPIILMGLLPGPHKVLIELADANHRILGKAWLHLSFQKRMRPKSRRSSCEKGTIPNYASVVVTTDEVVDSIVAL